MTNRKTINESRKVVDCVTNVEKLTQIYNKQKDNGNHLIPIATLL
jgi:hypothetical protein